MKKLGKNKITATLGIIILLLGIGYFITSIFVIKDNKIFHIINSFLLSSVIIIYIMDSFDKDKLLYKVLFTFTIGLVVIFNVMSNFNVFAEKQIIIEDLTKTSVNDLLVWAKDNNIIIEQTYEYSDNIEEFGIISQNILVGTPLNEISILKVVVSMGPNYDKLVIIPDLTGLNIDDVIKKKDELFLNNVVINYEINNEFNRNTVISQSLKGQFKRNAEIKFIVSLGNEILPTTMIDLKNKSLFDATLWLKQNGIKYNLNYEFNDTNRDYIISHDIQEGTTIGGEEVVNLIVSKGKSIKVPNLIQMKSDEVVKWISDNKLRIEFSDKYDIAVPLGTIISANYKENDEIEVGTLIKIVTSKGQLKMPEFTSLTDFRTWASNYDIKYSEEYQMNDTVNKGDIIKFSVNKGEVIDVTTNIIVYVSNGKPVTIPNFYGKTKGDITNICNNIGLYCTYYNAGYTDKDANVAVNQNFKAGSVVVSGANVNIGLSLGVAKTFTLYINQSSIMDCINSSQCTIDILKQLFARDYPGVNIKYIEKSSNTFKNAGHIHEGSPIKDGSPITQGKTYEIWITK